MPEVTKEELATVNQLHLQWLEDHTARIDLLIADVAVIQAYTYDMIQLMNGAWLKERLA